MKEKYIKLVTWNCYRWMYQEVFIAGITLNGME